MNKTVLFAFLIIAVISLDPPIFPEKYEVKFNETAKIGPSSGSTKGAIYYDATNNREVITRENGHHDRYCGTVYKFADTPCNHFIIGGKNFSILKEKDFWISRKRSSAATVATQPTDAES